MVDSRDIAIITCVDCNKKIVVDNQLLYRLYEQEAIRCFSCWRLNGGWLKDISIYALNPKNAKMTKNTLNKFKQLNVTYIEDYNANIANSKLFFVDKLYSQQYFEKSNKIREKYLIYIDLDVFLIKPLPYIFFQAAEQGKILLTKHDKVNKYFGDSFLYRYNNITKYLNGNCYNAQFVLEDKTNRYFQILYDLIYSPKYKRFFDEVALFRRDGRKDDYYLFEETLYDYQWYLKIFNDKIVNLNLSETENIYYKHRHITFRELVGLEFHY